MKTTIDLPSELVREMKLQAVYEGRKLKDVATEIFRRGLNHGGSVPTATKKRVKFPLIQCQHLASANTELTPDKVAEILLQQEVASAR